VQRVDQSQVFYTYEWSLAVQRAYQATLHPLLFLAYDEGESLCGVAALASDVSGRRVSFLCATTGDYCDFLSLPEHKHALVGGVLAELRKLGIGDITLTNLPADSSTVSALEQACTQNGYRSFARTAYVCAQVSLAKLERKPGENKPVLPGRKMLRRSLSAMGREAPVRLDHARSWDAAGPILPRFMRAHVARFLATGRVSNMAQPERRRFLEELAKLLSEPGWLALTRMMAGENEIAWNYGFQFQGTWFWYQPTFDSELEKYSPGFCLLAKLIEEAAENPALSTVDLGLGAEEYKERFANQSRETLYVTLRTSSVQHVREILRYRAAELVKTSPKLEAAVRAAVARLRNLRESVGRAGVVAPVQLPADRGGGFLQSEGIEGVPEPSTAGSPPLGSERLNFKTEMGRIARQSGVVFGGTIFTILLGYAFKVYLARVLGAEALGIYALGITIVSFLGVFNVMGLPESAVRFVALYSASKRYEELRSLLWNGSWILMAANLIFAVVLLEAGPWIATRFYHSPQLARYLPLFAPIMITSVINTFLGSVLAGYREVGRRTMITKFVASPVTMVVSVLLIALGGGLWGYLAAQIVSAATVMVLLISMVWRLTPVAARSPDLKRLWMGRDVWWFSAAMFGGGLMHFFSGQTDKVALGVYRGAHEVGIYTVAAALVAYETIVMQSVNQIFAPVIADLDSRGERALLGRLFQTLTKWMLGLTFPLAMVMIIFARPIMRMFGHDFEAGWPILIIGTCGQLVNCGVGSVGYLLLMSGNQRLLIRIQAVMAAVAVLLSFLLVPRWGVLGAAVAAAITNAGTNVWNLVEVRKVLRLSPYNRSYLRLLPSVGSALLIALLVSKASLFGRSDWMVVAASLVLAYVGFSVTAFAMGLDADDRLIANAVWARARGFFGR